MANILEHWIITQYILPLLLVYLIVYALLEKTKILGEGQKQINAVVALVISILFVGVASPKLVVSNLILFLTVALIIMFVALLLWGFITGEEAKLPGGKGLKIGAGVVILIAVIWGVFWAMGIETGISNFLFNQKWSEAFWTNALFIIVIVVALGLALKGKTGK
jgi:hypothetical protein